MQMSYFLVFLFGLLPLSTLTAVQSGGTTLNVDDEAQKLLEDRFHIRGWSKTIKTDQSAQKSLEDHHGELMQESLGKLEEPTPEDISDGFPRGEKPAVKKSEEKMQPDKPSSHVARITNEKLEEMPKNRTAGCQTGEKASHVVNSHNVEEINELEN